MKKLCLLLWLLASCNILLAQWNQSAGDNSTTGRVSIGTTSFSTDDKLWIEGSSKWQIRLKDAGAGGVDWRIGSTGNSWSAGGGRFLISNSTTSSAAAFTIDQTNRVGIGTVSPLHKLEIADPSGVPTLGLRGAWDSKIIFEAVDASDRFTIWADTDPVTYNDLLRFQAANATDAFIIKGDGRIGIGTAAPRGKLDVDGAGDIYLSDDPSAGTAQSLFIPGHVFISPYNGSNISYFQARRPDNSGTTSLQFRTTNAGTLVEALTIAGNGNIGIGIVTPLEKLSVTGNLRVQGSSGFNHSELNFYRGDGAKFATIGQGNLSAANSTFDIAHHNGNDIRFMQGSTEVMRILANGSVGIGSTTTNNMKLAVEGKIGAREVNVLVGPWPDYVFEKNYGLRTLTEVESYINQNKHLPEIPAAKEMEQNGVNLGEMNMMLLKKIEELTLYVIDLKKENEEQRKQNEIQQIQIKKLEEKLK